MNRASDYAGGAAGDIAIIGVGDFGGDVLGRLWFREEKRPILIRVNWMDHLPEISGEMIHVCLDESFRGMVLGDPISAGKATASVGPQIIGLLHGAAFVVLVAQPGDGVGSGGTTAMADALKRARIPFLTLLVLPDCEAVGRKRHMTARSTISELCVMKETPVVFDQADFPGFTGAFHRAVTDKIQTLVDALSPSMIPLDFNRIRNALTGSAANAVSTATVMGKTRAVEAAELVLSDPAVEPFLGRPASVLLHLQSDESLSLFEIDEAANIIIENWGDDVDLTYGVGEGGCQPGELRMGMIVGEYIGDMDEMVETESESHDEIEVLMSEAFTRLRAGSGV
ncbi:hypothetical protein JXA80_09910 [bacterium]|nr:hypothetical protein [candidate division CSSED10-310 bacterium]